ncbi:MAG: adenosylmethionine-8-amino-7-oxononanoate aminotransferase [Gammaproteobacteria bacterium]|jgi:adenosylmethionine-8-amino-7-oxononanoate aminotransferase
MNLEDIKHLEQVDANHIWHPYTAMHGGNPVYVVESAKGSRIKLADGRELIDGMSSWWCAMHGYNHPVLNQAVQDQLGNMSHVMFGGLTHAPAAKLVEKLVEITPEPLVSVFLSDSGSVSVDVAMKMAIQYWHAKGKPSKYRFVSLLNGYHGDTFGAMSVCDPVNGMHSLFSNVLAKQFFVDSPDCKFGEPCSEQDIASLSNLLKTQHDDIAAVILEPIVQGAGGMRFYSADYLKQARLLCDRYDVLLIADEIATGFGRTGKLFACEHADISPDIMCIGKSLTGGYMTLAATLATLDVSSTIDQGNPGVFMHGPTFMANPLACAVALASILLLKETHWLKQVASIELSLESNLRPFESYTQVKDVRVLGAIGVIELHEPVNMKWITEQFVKSGFWVRPFGRLVYLMPPFVIDEVDLTALCQAVGRIVKSIPSPES